MTTLLVASTGGHLAELYDLAPRMGIGTDARWVTFDSPQSRSLLAGREVEFVPPATSRDAVGTLRDYIAARRILRGGRFTRVISTGASVAAAFFLPAGRAGIACHYVESATRTEGPSLTGRLVARLPRTHLYTQYAGWADARWQHEGSVFDAYSVRRSGAPRPVRKVVVALGTHPRYGFGRLIERLQRVLPPSAEVLWQVGATDLPGIPAGARGQVPYAELQQAMREADVVICHAGVGSALAALQAGHRPIFVPRRRAFGEHVDDHQLQIARHLAQQNLVLAREADTVTAEDFAAATTWITDADPRVAPFRLAGPARLHVPAPRQPVPTLSTTNPGVLP